MKEPKLVEVKKYRGQTQKATLAPQPSHYDLRPANFYKKSCETALA